MNFYIAHKEIEDKILNTHAKDQKNLLLKNRIDFNNYEYLKKEIKNKNYDIPKYNFPEIIFNPLDNIPSKLNVTKYIYNGSNNSTNSISNNKTKFNSNKFNNSMNSSMNNINNLRRSFKSNSINKATNKRKYLLKANFNNDESQISQVSFKNQSNKYITDNKFIDKSNNLLNFNKSVHISIINIDNNDNNEKVILDKDIINNMEDNEDEKYNENDKSIFSPYNNIKYISSDILNESRNNFNIKQQILHNKFQRNVKGLVSKEVTNLLNDWKMKRNNSVNLNDTYNFPFMSTLESDKKSNYEGNNYNSIYNINHNSNNVSNSNSLNYSNSRYNKLKPISVKNDFFKDLL